MNGASAEQAANRLGLEKLPPETRLEIVPWSDVSDGTADNYSRQVPSLARVRKQLSLNAPTR